MTPLSFQPYFHSHFRNAVCERLGKANNVYLISERHGHCAKTISCVGILHIIILLFVSFVLSNPAWVFPHGKRHPPGNDRLRILWNLLYLLGYMRNWKIQNIISLWSHLTFFLSKSVRLQLDWPEYERSLIKQTLVSSGSTTNSINFYSLSNISLSLINIYSKKL